MIGPAATATPLAAPHTPIAFARSDASSKTFVMTASVAGKISAASIELGISRPTLYELMEKLGISPKNDDGGLRSEAG
jgi:transcriptional regulator of acetoin/glycerol metabolism